MRTLTRTLFLMIALLALSASAAPGVIKATSSLELFVRDGTQIVQVRVTKFDPAKGKGVRNRYYRFLTPFPHTFSPP